MLKDGDLHVIDAMSSGVEVLACSFCEVFVPHKIQMLTDNSGVQSVVLICACDLLRHRNELSETILTKMIQLTG